MKFTHETRTALVLLSSLSWFTAPTAAAACFTTPSSRYHDTLSAPPHVTPMTASVVATTTATLTAPPPQPPSPPPTRMDWSIRTATNADIVNVETWLHKKGAFDRSLHGRPPSKLTSTAGTTLSSLFPRVPSGKVLLASSSSDDDRNDHDQDVDVGFLLYELQYSSLDAPPALWMEDLFVDPTTRSQGAGQALMTELCAIGRQYNVQNIGWQVACNNARGLQFYQDKMGANVIDQDDALLNMEWERRDWN